MNELDDVNYFPRGHDLPAGFHNAVQVALSAGVTVRQVHYWTLRGYLFAEDNGAGSGYQRAYSDSEVAVARRIGELVAQGYVLRAAAMKARK